MKMILFLLITFFGLEAFATTDYSKVCKNLTTTSNESDPYNKKVMQAVRSMPQDLGYDIKDDAAHIDDLKKAVTIKNGKIDVDAAKAGVSFCTIGTYMVFMKLVGSAGPKLSQEDMQALLPQSKKQMPDGVGFWGRWNADGPGIGYALKETNVGQNFTDINKAHQGDFLTIGWKSGSTHSVVFDSIQECQGQKTVCYWGSSSSNDKSVPQDRNGKPGFNYRCSPMSSVSQFYLTRVKDLNHLRGVDAKMGPKSDNFRSTQLAPDVLTNKKPRMTKAIEDSLLYGNAPVASNTGVAAVR